ncbi:hypothetical protein [Cysteiniphilum sp. 6C5]|uniref:hypothetical protein n=1 Tax=unclassified Cysteiniphilum TaxID=2610889 RepID=UPI003F86D46A
MFFTRFNISLFLLLVSVSSHGAQLPITIINADKLSKNALPMAMNFGGVDVTLEKGNSNIESSPANYSFSNIDEQKRYQLQFQTGALVSINADDRAYTGIALEHQTTKAQSVVVNNLRFVNQAGQGLMPLDIRQGNCYALPDGQIDFDRSGSEETCTVQYEGTQLVNITSSTPGKVSGYFSADTLAEAGVYNKQMKITISEAI